MAYGIDQELCVGCGACKWVCLFDVPAACAPGGAQYTIDQSKCVGCGHCEPICPNNAIAPLPDHKRLLRVSVIAENCIGCTVCYHVCPEKAPFGERGKPFEIDQAKCTQCGMCVARCRHDALKTEYED